ncbi:MAG: peptidylprolyl isomerase [Dysgonamonadaceae bacterium]|jgi:peptidyl-prolyl cis-trans isomerase A (cyclophilin A)|nr:peptidylprolyl isomerase [Dysgonamonadaceae bacterium]
MKKAFYCLIIALMMISCGNKQLPKVTIKTQFGVITAEIYTDKAPVTAGNFLKLVNEGAYNTGDAKFYRTVRPDNQSNTVKIEVIQGGLNDRDVFPAIIHETTRLTGIKHLDGTLSMARSEPGTASSEFFICIGEQPELDFDGNRNPDKQGFAAFGRVIDGMDAVRMIQQQQDTTQYLVNPVPFTISR